MHVCVCVCVCVCVRVYVSITVHTQYLMYAIKQHRRFFLLSGFVAGNYARVLSGPHRDLQGKVRISTSDQSHLIAAHGLLRTT